jgi:hypothetical protein
MNVCFLDAAAEGEDGSAAEQYENPADLHGIGLQRDYRQSEEWLQWSKRAGCIFAA